MDADRDHLLKELSARLLSLCLGQSPDPVPSVPDADPSLQELCEAANSLFAAFRQAQAFIGALAKGDLDVDPPRGNLLLSPYKQLHAGLRHLTWQTRRIAEGDYSQRVHFMGDFSTAFNSMVKALEEKRQVEESLRVSDARIKRLEGIIPICSFCKKIRDDSNLWQQMEAYVSDHSEAQFSHSICPACMEKHYGDL